MKRVLALFLAAVSFLLPAGASATGQTAERLIVGCDTMSLYALPLMKADSTVLARLEKRLKEIDAPWSTACWRAYIGVWRLDKGRLWLERVETTKGDPVFTGAELFPKSAEGSRARADWFSGEIRYGTGALVYYQHDGFKRNLEREWVAEIFEGRVGRGTKAYRNRLYKCGVEMMDNVVRVAAAFDSLYVGTLPDQLALSVVFAPDSTGRVAQIDRARLLMPGGEKIEDAADPRLQAAVQAFRSVTRWDRLLDRRDVEEAELHPYSAPERKGLYPPSSAKTAVAADASRKRLFVPPGQTGLRFGKVRRRYKIRRDPAFAGSLLVCLRGVIC